MPTASRTPHTHPPLEAAAAPGPRRRVFRRTATTLAWISALLYPIAVFQAVQTGPYRSAPLRSALCAALTVLPMWLLRRNPLAALVLMLAGALAASATGQLWWEVAYLLVLVDDAVVAHIALTKKGRTSLAAAALTLLVHTTVASQFTPASGDFVNTALVWALAVVAAWMVGRTTRERRQHAAALRTQAAAQAVTAERLRIARELHDMIAHSIGVIAIQAGVGNRVIDSQPAEARKALTVIEATSRETLAGLRRTLGALRRTDREADGGPGPREPAPGLDDLARLTARTADAGVQVEVEWRGERRPLPADIDLAAYRIVQEALTNVVRHAGTARCRVTIDYQEAELTIVVDDEGRGGETAPGTGFGIVGMRERVALLHGRFTAGPRPGAGFRVAAVLPVPVGATAGTQAPATVGVTGAAVAG